MQNRCRKQPREPQLVTLHSFEHDRSTGGSTHAHHACDAATCSNTARGALERPAMHSTSGWPPVDTRCSRQPSAARHSASDRSSRLTASRSIWNSRHLSHWRNISTRVTGACMHCTPNFRKLSCIHVKKERGTKRGEVITWPTSQLICSNLRCQAWEQKCHVRVCCR